MTNQISMGKQTTAPKHIGFLAPTAYNYFQGKGFGGAELQVMQLARLLVKSGYQVTVRTNDYGQKDEEIFEDIHIVKAPLRFLGGSNWYFLPDTVRFIKTVKKLNFDWCFFLTPNTALFQLGLANLFCKNMKICKYIASDADCLAKKNLPYLLYRLGLKFTDSFFFQTNIQQRLAEKNLHIYGDLLPNIFIPQDNQDTNLQRDIDILWVGAFDEKKRPDRLLEIARQLPQYKFTVISKPISESYKELEKAIRSLPNVDFVGTVPFEKTQSYFDRAQLHLSTSAVEGFPNTFLQAWWARSPVVSVTFPCDGLLEKEKIGILSGSLEKTIEDIDMLMQNRDLRVLMGEKGRQYVQDNHLPDITLNRLENMMKKYGSEL